MPPYMFLLLYHIQIILCLVYITIFKKSIDSPLRGGFKLIKTGEMPASDR